MFRTKAKKRLKIWNQIRTNNKKIADEKKAIKKRLMQKYNFKEFYSRVFWYWSKDWIHSCEDEDGHTIDYKVGDILPYKRAGDLVFFYKVTDINRKYGDYGMSDYGYFYDLTYSHYRKIPEKLLDKKKSTKIKWEKVIVEGKKFVYKGFVQGIRIVNLKVNQKKDYEEIRSEYTCNISHGSLPRYWDNHYNITEGKKEIQAKVDKVMNNGANVKQFFIEPGISRKNK